MKKRALIYCAPRAGGMPWLVVFFDEAEEAHRFLARYPVLGQKGAEFEVGAGGSVLAIDAGELPGFGWVSVLPSDAGAEIVWPVKP